MRNSVFNITKTCPCNIQRFFFFFSEAKIEISLENLIFFNIFAQNIHCGYTLELARQGRSNKYPKCMFLMKTKNIRYTPANPIFFYIKVGFEGVYMFS